MSTVKRFGLHAALHSASMKPAVIVVNDITQPGGTERAAVNLAELLIADGRPVTILSLFSNSGRPPFACSATLRVWHAGLNIAQNTVQRLLNTVRALGRLGLERGSILIGTTVAINTALALVPRRQGWRTVGCEHFNYEDTSALNQRVRRWAYPRLHRVVVLTETDRQRYLQDGLQTTVIPNSLSLFPEATSNLEQTRLLAVGRLIPRKGFTELVEIVAPLLKRHPVWSLDIIGSGELRENLQHQVEGHGLTGRVHLVPATPAIDKHYQNSAIYLMSSRSEAFGLVIIEAKAYGLPVVAFDAPHGPRDIVRPDDGFLVPMDRPDLFAQHTEVLMTNPELRRQMGAQARKNVQMYLPERIAPLWRELLKM